MAYYLFLADRHGTGSGARWAIMGIAVKVAQSVRHNLFHFLFVSAHGPFPLADWTT